MNEERKVSAQELERIIGYTSEKYTKNLTDNFVKLLIFIIIFGLYMSIPKTTWLIPSKYTSEKINTDNNPVMIINNENVIASKLSEKSDYEKLIEIKSFKSKKKYYLMPLAEYSISARIKDKNNFFYMHSDFDDIALVDYGLVWGEFAKNENFNKIYASSNQVVNARRLVFHYKDKYSEEMYKKFGNSLSKYASHTHIIPANKKVMKALKAVRNGQTVKLDGYLVDTFDSNFHRFAMTSLSLSDSNESSRGYGQGGGACEVMYVVQVQVGDKIFN